MSRAKQEAKGITEACFPELPCLVAAGGDQESGRGWGQNKSTSKESAGRGGDAWKRLGLDPLVARGYGTSGGRLWGLGRKEASRQPEERLSQGRWPEVSVPGPHLS